MARSIGFHGQVTIEENEIVDNRPSPITAEVTEFKFYIDNRGIPRAICTFVLDDGETQVARWTIGKAAVSINPDGELDLIDQGAVDRSDFAAFVLSMNEPPVDWHKPNTFNGIKGEWELTPRSFLNESTNKATDYKIYTMK